MRPLGVFHRHIQLQRKLYYAIFNSPSTKTCSSIAITMFWNKKNKTKKFVNTTRTGIPVDISHELGKHNHILLLRKEKCIISVLLSGLNSQVKWDFLLFQSHTVIQFIMKQNLVHGATCTIKTELQQSARMQRKAHHATHKTSQDYIKCTNIKH